MYISIREQVKKKRGHIKQEPGPKTYTYSRARAFNKKAREAEVSPNPVKIMSSSIVAALDHQLIKTPIITHDGIPKKCVQEPGSIIITQYFLKKGVQPKFRAPNDHLIVL